MGACHTQTVMSALGLRRTVQGESGSQEHVQGASPSSRQPAKEGKEDDPDPSRERGSLYPRGIENGSKQRVKRIGDQVYGVIWFCWFLSFVVVVGLFLPRNYFSIFK